MNPLSYAEIVSGVANIPSGSERPRRVVSKIVDTPVVEAAVSNASCLDHLLYKHRSGKKEIKFVELSGPQRAAFYSKTTDFIEKGATVLRDGDVQHLSLMDGARRVAADLDIIIDNKHDLQRIKSSVHNRMQARKATLPDIVAPSPPIVALGDATIAVNNRRRFAGRRRPRNPNDIDSRQRRFPKACHGLENHLVCQEMMKAKATVASAFVSAGISMNVVAFRMMDSLRAKDIEVSKNTCITHIKNAINNGGMGISPQKTGGCALPSSIEKKIASSVIALRRLKFPVFPDEVMKRAGEAIAGIPFTDMFENGCPGRGWYRGRLRRMEFQVGTMRPLDLTREAWYTENNLVDYFDVAKEVLLNTIVSMINPDYDPTEVYSQEILITHPGRICSYDETRLELDCTKPRKGKGN
jgi:hypothetical protein